MSPKKPRGGPPQISFMSWMLGGPLVDRSASRRRADNDDVKASTDEVVSSSPHLSAATSNPIFGTNLNLH